MSRFLTKSPAFCFRQVGRYVKSVIVVSQTGGLSICHTANSVNANMYNTWAFCFEQAIMIQMLWRQTMPNMNRKTIEHDL